MAEQLLVKTMLQLVIEVFICSFLLSTPLQLMILVYNAGAEKFFYII